MERKFIKVGNFRAKNHKNDEGEPARMLTGEYRHTIDNKNRIFIPSKHREELGAQFIVARDIREKCLKVYSLEGWANYIAPIKQLDRSLAEKTMRFLHRNASQVTPDSQGRIVIPLSLSDHAEIKRDVVVVGCSDYDEIWAQEIYDANVDSEDGDAIRAALESCGL